MHPKKLTRAWAAAGLLAALTALTGGPVGAQEKKDPPMATPDRTGAISVTIGGQVRVQMKSKKRIKEAFNENDRVVQVLADASDPSALILIGRAAGTSRLEITDVDGAKENYLVVVQRDVEALRNLIKRAIPTALVEVTPVGEAGNSVVLSGSVQSETDRETIKSLAETLGLKVAVNTITVGGGGLVPHVQLDVTLARVSRSRARSRGANFILNGSDASAGSILGGITSVTPGTTGISIPNGLGLGVQPQAPIFAPGSAANLIFGFAPANFQFLLAALKSEGLAKLVAAPTLVARSGEEADMLVGGQIPVISAAAGINGPGVSYRPVGTELRFLPVVYGNGKIHLTVSPRVTRVNNAQALTTTFGTSPAFEEQRLTTSVIMEPGQTFALGGLIQTTQDSAVTKIPHLGDLPFLGPLFSFATSTEEEIEMVILVTPRVVDPADCSQMPKALPGSETRKPDDYEFYLETILEAPRGQRQIWNGGEYVPAWKAGPSANLYPCAGNGGYGGCGDGGKCGAPGAGPAVAPGATVPVRKVGPHPGMLPEPPTVHADPLTAPPPSLLDPARPDRKTAELPQK
jgi:pilus assembly protein CpaC